MGLSASCADPPFVALDALMKARLDPDGTGADEQQEETQTSSGLEDLARLAAEMSLLGTGAPDPWHNDEQHRSELEFRLMW